MAPILAPILMSSFSAERRLRDVLMFEPRVAQDREWKITEDCDCDLTLSCP